MKLSKKLFMISAGVLMAISPLAPSFNQPTTVQAADKNEQVNTLYVSRKSYIYTKNGNRTVYNGKNYISFGKRVKFLSKVSDYNGKNKYYFKDRLGNDKIASYKVFKGKAYFQIGKNAYIRVVNVSYIGNYKLYAKTATAKVSSKYATKGRQPAYDSNGNPIKDTYFKAEKRLILDGQKYIDVGNSIATFYRVKGTNKFVDEDNVSEVRQTLPFLDVKNTHVLTNKATKLYTADGKIKVTIPHTTDMVDLRKGYPLSIDEAVYLWVPSDNKVELFFRVVSGWMLAGKDYDYTDLRGYVKASDIDYNYGPAFPTPTNTSSEAEKGRNIATESDKQSLKKLINENLIDSNTYKFSPTKAQENYAGSLQYAKTVVASKTSTINEINQAEWELKMFQNALSGQKVKVANLGWIDRSTANEITRITSFSYGNANAYAISMVNHNTQLRLIEYKLLSGGGTNGTIKDTKFLDLNDYVTETDPNPTEKDGFESSLSEKDLAKNLTLQKYQKLITYNELTTALVAKKDTYVYTNKYRNNYDNVSKGNIKLTKTNQVIKQGNNLGYYAGPVVKINNQYYVMFRAKKHYFYIRADQISRDNFTNEAAYKKYNNELQKALADSPRGNVKVEIKVNTYQYDRNSYGEFRKTQFQRADNIPLNMRLPHVIKYNGEWFYTYDYPSITGLAWLAKDVKVSAND